MKKNILIKQILGTDSVKQNPASGVMVETRKDTLRNRMDESSLTVTKAENKMQPMDEFRYSQRCYCGVN